MLICVLPDVALLEEALTRNASKESLSSEHGQRDEDNSTEWLSEVMKSLDFGLDCEYDST